MEETKPNDLFQMPARIEKLQENVLRVLKSQVFVVSVTSAVRELLQNSVDAGASEIEAVLDFHRWRLIIFDNGHGMTPEDLDSLGEQNYTSKLAALDDLHNVETYGFRGEGIYSIKNVAKVSIASRKSGYNSTWIRELNISGSKSSRLTEVTGEEGCFNLKPITLHRSGTTVLVQDFFHCLPVRKQILKRLPLFKLHNEVKDDVFQILVYHPHIRINISTIDQSGTRSTLVNSKNITGSLTTTQKLSLCFRNVFGTVIPHNLVKKVSAKYRNYSVEGVIFSSPVPNKDYQFIFINGRKYRDSAFFKSINKIFEQANFGYSNEAGSDYNAKSVGKPYSVHPVLILKTSLPNSISDLLQDPSKEIFYSKHLSVLQPLIFKVVETFLNLHGYSTKAILSPSKKRVHEADISRPSSPTSPGFITTRTDHCSRGTADLVLNSKIKMAKLSEREVLGRLQESTLPREAPNSKRICRIKPFINKKSMGSSFIGVVNKQEYEDNRNHTNGSQVYDQDSEMKGNNFKHLNDHSVEDFKIKRSHLKNCHVVNQVDNKFILLRVGPKANNHCCSLLIVDQHACDERIRLESYIKEFVFNALSFRGLNTVQKHINIEVSSTEAQMFKHFHQEFVIWKIDFEISESVHGNFVLNIYSLPDIVDMKVGKDIAFLKKILLQHLHDLKSHRKLRATSIPVSSTAELSMDNFKWWRYINCIPTLFMEIFNSKACRSAIMFGDALTKAECQLLIRELCTCQLPFQCAHGRPSVIPIVELNSLSSMRQLSFGGSCADYVVE